DARTKGAGSFRRNREGGSIPFRLGGQANTCPLSLVSQAGGALSGMKTRRYAGRSILLFSLPVEVHGMNVIELTRALIDIESITNNEERIGNFLFECLAPLAAKYDGHVERVEVEPRRFNLFAQWGERLDVTLSTHMDTVPPFFASSEDDENIWGRGACDTKGIIASMVAAITELLESGQRSIGLLLVVGEERNSAGAM